MALDKFALAEQEYNSMRALFQAGQLTQEQFDAKLRELIVQDDQGRYWTLRSDTGGWFYHDGTRWIAGKPSPAAAAPPAAGAPPSPAAVPASPASAPPAAAPMLSLPVIALIAVLVVLLIGGAAALLLLSPRPTTQVPASTPTTIPTAVANAPIVPTDTALPPPTDAPLPTDTAESPTEPATAVVLVVTATPPPTEADTETPEPTETEAPTETPENPLAQAEMVLIPEGSFTMGSSEGDADARPPHTVSLDAFHIDLTEVTNARYRACVALGKCTRAARANSATRSGYRDDASYDDYPVIGVTWDQANTFCAAAGMRLPTEAEWEYAARGSEDLIFPWGNTFDPSLLPAAEGDTQPVGSYPEGASPFGVLDLAGNVTEWVADAYTAGFYANAPEHNPVNANGDMRVYRGGAFDNTDPGTYAASQRYHKPHNFQDVDVGFRCAADAN